MAHVKNAPVATQLLPLSTVAYGHLGPSHIGLTEESLQQVHQLAQMESSYAPVSPLVLGCVDGRRDTFGACIAGGAITLAVGYIAAHGLRSGETLVDVLRHVADLGYTIILHEGCGALKFLNTILCDDMAICSSGTCSLLEKLGTPTSDAQRNTLATISRAVSDNFVPDEALLFDAVKKMGGQVERFRAKDHREVETILNTCSGTSFKREVLKQVAGDPQVFVLDAWILPDAARRLASVADAQARAQYAMLFYDAAVLLRLAGADHQIETHA